MSISLLKTPITKNDIVKKINELTANCPRRVISRNSILSPSQNDICTWTINHNLNDPYAYVKIFFIDTENDEIDEVLADVSCNDANTVTVNLLSSSVIPEDTYIAVVYSISFDENEPIASQGSKNLSDHNMTKLADDLYFIKYSSNELNYQKTINDFNLIYDNTATGVLDTDLNISSTIIKNSLMGRNLSDYLNNTVTFVVKTESGNGKHSVLGISSYNITKSDAESRVYTKKYEYLPFLLKDGINDAGLRVAMNAVPTGDNGKTTGTNQLSSGNKICMLMLVRYILDNFDNVDSAVAWIRNAKIYAPYTNSIQQEYQFIIGNSEKTMCVEFHNNACSTSDVTNTYFTNFYYINTDFSGTLPDSTAHSKGLERYKLIDNIYSISTVMDMLDEVDPSNLHLLSELDWCSDYNGTFREYGDLTTSSVAADYEDIISDTENAYANGDPTAIDTKYTAIYDLSDKSVTIQTKLSNEFNINLYGNITIP